jgi:hypothetical protein
MTDIVRIDFEERDQQWQVTLVTADNEHRPGEPFPAYGGENFSKLEQVLNRVKVLGYRPTHTPYNQAAASRIVIDVTRA